jgi:transcriptional regulator of arginine metabolism
MKKERQYSIKEILSKVDIETQEQLAGELNKKGLKVTQTTISRDINELNLARVRKPNGKIVYRYPEQNKLAWMMKELVNSVEDAQNMLVVKVSSGTAQAVASEIDAMLWSEMLGSIAGDDTILLITKTKVAADNLLGRFKKMMA